MVARKEECYCSLAGQSENGHNFGQLFHHALKQPFGVGPDFTSIHCEDHSRSRNGGNAALQLLRRILTREDPLHFLVLRWLVRYQRRGGCRLQESSGGLALFPVQTQAGCYPTEVHSL